MYIVEGLVWGWGSRKEFKNGGGVWFRCLRRVRGVLCGLVGRGSLVLLLVWFCF